ncbi:MAG TPA: hypothetical protein VEK31_09185, partial [Xanthobacteraceae bacterium]|nr:hypothetical protein [Xanthobacteraceae bacterium]
HETRVYVVRVTGLSVDTWRSVPIDNDALTFVQHLPCRSLPAFANVEREQAAQMHQMPQLQAEDAKDEDENEDDEAADEPAKTGSTAHAARKHDGDDERVHERKHAAEAKRAAEGKHEHAAHDEAHRPTHERRAARREASHAPHTAHEKHKSA